MTIYKSAAGKKKILELYDKQLERLGTGYGGRKRLSVSRKKSAAHRRANHSECHYLFTGGQRAYEQSDGRGETNDYGVFKTRLR